MYANHFIKAAVAQQKLAHIVTDGKYTEWITNLRATKHGLNQSFRVFVFLGDFNPDPATWPFERSMVGRFAVLARDAATPCANCQANMADDLAVTGTVPLTTALLQDVVDGKVASLGAADVEPYLLRNLHWRVVLFDSTEQPRELVPGLKVSVCSTTVTVGEDDMPQFSDEYTLHPAVTNGRPGGHGVGDPV